MNRIQRKGMTWAGVCVTGRTHWDATRVSGQVLMLHPRDAARKSSVHPSSKMKRWYGYKQKLMAFVIDRGDWRWQWEDSSWKQPFPEMLQRTGALEDQLRWVEKTVKAHGQVRSFHHNIYSLWVLMQKENTEQFARYSELCEPKSSAWKWCELHGILTKSFQLWKALVALDETLGNISIIFPLLQLVSIGLIIPSASPTWFKWDIDRKSWKLSTENPPDLSTVQMTSFPPWQSWL